MVENDWVWKPGLKSLAGDECGLSGAPMARREGLRTLTPSHSTNYNFVVDKKQEGKS